MHWAEKTDLKKVLTTSKTCLFLFSVKHRSLLNLIRVFSFQFVHYGHAIIMKKKTFPTVDMSKSVNNHEKLSYFSVL